MSAFTSPFLCTILSYQNKKWLWLGLFVRLDWAKRVGLGWAKGAGISWVKGVGLSWTLFGVNFGMLFYLLFFTLLSSLFLFSLVLPFFIRARLGLVFFFISSLFLFSGSVRPFILFFSSPFFLLGLIRPRG